MSKLGPCASSDSPVSHIQEEGAAGRVQLEAQQPLELGDQHIFIRGAHATKLLHELLVQIDVHALHEQVSRGSGGITF